MLDKWFKKEKPVFTGVTRGVGGFGFGAAASLVPGSTIFDGTWASGGVVGDYESGGNYYRVHVFVEPGTFTVSDSSLTDIDYLVVAGGGGGGGANLGADAQGGGGAGGVRSNHPDMPASVKAADFPVTPGNYDVQVGDGGHGGLVGPSPFSLGAPGNPSYFRRNGVSSPNVLYVEATGGGGGGGWNGTASDRQGDPGGSGGGNAGGSGNPASTGNINPDPNHPKVQGYAGGQRGPNYSGGGGGGFLGAGASGDSSNHGGDGGPGVDCSITGTTLGYGGGGGAGGVDPYGRPPSGSDAGTGTHGGGTGAKGTGPFPSYFPDDVNGRVASGGGGGGGCGTNSPAPEHDNITKNDLHSGGHGGPGVVAVSYQIPSSAGTAAATGGIITFTPTKVVHTFYEPGTWTKGTVSSIDLLVVAGGGSGGGMNAGGGGGGVIHYRTSHPVPGDSSFPIIVGVGGRGSTGAVDLGDSDRGIGEQGQASRTGPLGVDADGGGFGGTNNPQNGGGNGGSGGGGSDSGSGGTGSGLHGHPGAADVVSPPLGWGNNGGDSSNGSSGGGGGGATAVGGGPPEGETGGAGGAGAVYTISGSPVTYAGGGGGGGRPGGSGGDGGSGGGGNGSNSTAPGGNGAVGTGGGGGGGCYNAPVWEGGGSGGPGIVIIAYPKS